MTKDDDPVIRVSISLRMSLWKRIEEYRARESVVTTADAVRRLLSDALRAAEKGAKK